MNPSDFIYFWGCKDFKLDFRVRKENLFGVEQQNSNPSFNQSFSYFFVLFSENLIIKASGYRVVHFRKSKKCPQIHGQISGRFYSRLMICVWKLRHGFSDERFYSPRGFSVGINLNKIATQSKCLLPEYNQTLDIDIVVVALQKTLLNLNTNLQKSI